MSILNFLKKWIRKIFVDYNEINRICANNIKSIDDKISITNSEIELKSNNIKEDIVEIKKQQGVLENEITNIKKQNEITIKELKKISDQFLFYNMELANIKIDVQLKNILIVGFYGAPNLGDELMLETLLEYLENIPNKKITVLLADNPEYDIEKYKDVRFIHYPKTLYDFNIIAEQYDYIIFGGGAIIDDKQFEKENAYQYDLGTILLKLSIRAIAFNKKVICLALSASKEILNLEYLEKLKYIIQNAHYFSVRDTYTKDYLTEKLGNECGNKIIKVSDIVLANKKIFENIKNKKQIKNELNIGIAWISNDNDINKVECVLNNIQEYVKKSEINECNVNFIPFYEYGNIDTVFYRKILKNTYSRLKINIEKYPENMKKTIDLFKKNDIIIGMRYHSILMAHALNIPCISVCYDVHAHYTYKIKYLNKLFEQDEALSYKNIEYSNFCDKLKEIYGQDNKNGYEKSRKIGLLAQKQILESINKIFN